MTETASTTKAPRKAVKAELPDTEVVDGFTLIHKGHGRYGIEGHANKEFPDRKAALGYISDLAAVAQVEEQFGDTLPAGIEINPRTVVYRGTLIELPMNEQYLPDGAHSPYYDRAWFWGWGRADSSDVAQKQALGYRIVTRDDLEAEVEEGRVPDHYRTLLLAVEHGTRMQYGDLVLMRIPRVLWRQYHAAQDKAALQRITRQDEANHEVFDRAGVKNVSGPISNEVSTGLKISGF